ncbi:unnamed protein product [Symbiodinium sp. CCMP2592]|nr:unnamed protein product [Symbiodinium sp. CCMP2592]
MYTVPAEAFLQMTEAKMHEELADAGVLSEFDESLGKAMFVSHQWLSDTHPDPDFQQLKVLQDAMKNIVAGTSSISQALFSEIVYGRRRCPTPADFAPSHLHIWYGYFSIPQCSCHGASQVRESAIQSIPAYVARCFFFVVLCPALTHRDQQRTLSHATWGERGWCRTERAARELSTHRGGYVIIVESAAHQTLLWAGKSMRDAPGEGEFTLDGDRARIGRLVTQMVWSKLFYYLEHGQFHNYRFLLNAQAAQYFRSLDVEPIDGLVPGFHTETDPSVDCKGFMLERFLHQNGFRSIFERDSAGWPPICFAAMSNNVVVLQALLDRKVDINQATTKPAVEVGLPAKLTDLGIACLLRNDEALELLLCARAHVNNKDGFGGNALHTACVGDHARGVRLLCHARANVNQQAMPGMSPLMISCACASRHAMKEMLNLNPGLSLRHGLHITLMFAGGGSADLVSVLLAARANVNEQFRVQIQEPGWWLLMNVMGVRHRVSPSRLTLLAYHRYDATPLMFSLLSGSLDSVSTLLSARARVDIRNYRKKTASDLARQMLAPSWLIEACSTKGEPDAEALAESSRAEKAKVSEGVFPTAMDSASLVEFASALHKHRDSIPGSNTFVMYTVLAEAFLQMTEVKMHEELADAGVLSEFDESLGKAMFVSHQWLSDTHPDPDFQQLKVLQDAMRNIVAGTSSISQALFSEIVYGRRRCPTAADFASSHLHIWYDYFSIPQSRDRRASQGRQTAIQSIPTYVARCEFFVVLCPALKHRDQQRTLSHATWGERGWCRTERAARELSTRSGGYVIIVESAAHQTLLWAGKSMRDAPGEGEFTLDGDRVWIGRMVTQMVWTKLFYYLEHSQFHNYRFLLNSHGAQCFRGLDVEPIDGLVPGFHTETDPSVDCNGFMLERFLHQNGLRNIFERDSAGWPPICFAAMSNNVVVLQALLDRKVDINQATTKPAVEINLPAKLTALGIACLFRNDEALELLLCARAHVNNKDGFGGNALHTACVGDHARGVRLLCHARANVNQQAMPGMSPLMISCACASRHAMKEMLNLNPGLSLRHCLHITLMFAGGGSADLVSVLLAARANVNEQFRVQIQEPGWWLLMTAMGVRHRVSPSRLTLLAYHHYDATPLMFSLLSGSLDSVSTLLSARARVDIRNYRKKTASDLARQMLAPSWLIEACSTKGEPDAEALAESDTFFI